MDRTKLFAKVTIDDIEELDFLDNNLTTMDMTRTITYYRVDDVDKQAPDNIAYKSYKNERLWWVVCLVNNLYNCSVDIVVGNLLKIPNILDVYDFYRKYRKR